MDVSSCLKMSSLTTQSLFSYVEEENLSAIKAHLDKYREVDTRSENGQTALMLASEQGSLQIVQELIRRGANVNLDDIDCWTALISAAKEGHTEVVKELLENNANVEHRDMGGWSALMWAAYKGRVEVAHLLLEKGANPNITGQYSVYPIIWAAGRGHAEIVQLLLQHGAKVNCSDKYGTTPLIWAARKGHYDCVMHLLENGANVDQEGANSMTALIVAVRGGFPEVVKELLKRNPNMNMTDKDGNTALMIAAIEGYTEIVQDLLDAGTYVNIPDRSGDTVLIGAVRGGHVEIVRALLNKYADIDVKGQDSKTALYWAVEKSNATMVRDILQCNPDTEAYTKDGETPLIKATKMRNMEIVELLLDKGAKVSAVDKKGDTALHIAIRGRSRKLAELLLRNPKDGRLLYRPNKEGETPYNIDCTHQKSILTQIFGAKHLSPSECDGDMLGYDLYSSALADILSEPTMQPPICVGLYAQWGSGKSFLLKKLEDEMKTFAGQQVEPLFQFSWLVVVLTLLLCGSVALVLGFAVDTKLAIAVALSLLALMYIFFVLVYFGGRKGGEGWSWAWVLSTRLARHIGYLELLLKLMFVNPPELPEQTTKALPVRFLFTDYNRLSSVGGETSMAEMIATLSDACEREFGFLATRLFRVFKNDETQGKKWKKTCCVPSFVLFVLTSGCLITGMTLLAIFKVDAENLTVNAVLISMASVVGLAVLLKCRTWWRVTDSVLHSQRRRLLNAANSMHKLKSEGFMKVLKCEVELMAKMAKTIDGFTQNQTRLAVIIDGLDSCEQDKVLQMLDTVRVLFSKGPFISIFASDPHIIIKAINQNLNSVLRDSNINGHDYMRNIIHLPVFLNSRGLSTAKRLCISTPATADQLSSDAWQEDMDRKLSQNSLGEQGRLGSKTALNRRDTYRRRQMQRSVTRQMSFDLTKLLVTEDWFSDISPQTMRRLLNIVSVTGRLLRANQIIFNWDRLASWINLTEEWPYRTSWIILFLEETDGVSDQVTLRTIYERISKNIPTTKDVEPLLEIDGDIRSFEVFLSSHTPVLTARDVEMFLPCTVNLDPKLREIIADVRDAREQMHLGGVSYPTLPLQDASVRPHSTFGQQSLACSPTGSFPGSFAPTGVLPAAQPHSSYFSGLTGPQHPFYNRPYFPHHVYHLPRHYPGSPHHAPSRPATKLYKDPSLGLDVIREDSNEGLPSPTSPSMIKSQPFRMKQGSGSVVSSGSQVLLSSLSIDGVCEKLRHIQGLDSSMLEQYIGTIKKANVNGRVLSQCNLDELKKEMNMNFGDWHLFRSMVLEQRHMENQLLRDELGACNEQGSSVLTQLEPHRPSEAPQDMSINPENFTYSLNLSFEELSGVGLEEPARQHNAHWLANTHRTPSISSLNSQESSNDICKLTDKQQAEYRNAYQEYISHMSQLEISAAGLESPAQALSGQFLTASSEEKTKEGGQDGRKPFPKKSSKPADTIVDFSSVPDGALLDPITEEDEKSEHGSAAKIPPRRKTKGQGPSYHSIPSDEEDSGEEETDATPLLREEPWAAEPDLSLLAKRKSFISDIMLDKKSSDSGVRSSRSSSDHSLQDEENEASQEKEEKSGEKKEEEAHLIELVLESPVKKRVLPHRLSNLQDEALARMSICSDAPSDSSSPEDSWPTSAVSNLNCSPDNTALNNNINNSAQQETPDSTDCPSIIIRPGSSTETTTLPNQNLCGGHQKRASGPATDAAEERESVL
ncbi:kinase D-interacting substrate of 220 kDa B-like isoform X1 [Carassius auratus]|uniref:Kinase D-interacting substrate of 220 kDa B-like isoform X1 n=1 Tax=Carassius auratus TaxID=7957 RepID=A0A6P6R8X8_CARAU|nr:kinase D-interacting substrate of 220 kDa B-like isoform X1 [Carassius auratus]XP_026141629.1 kinase D-interacting substrate of 220 kDa B-like isoform X1 [Carassius auratus]XP_026141630.1 kinase D-interacting substrate of 220 kDa B-like isoform X1 [Carassius auratus]XP_026141631.1 kinase D-interacting substrate of 220 kDa B-like isoform X1 [Carassius auratus]